MLTAVRHTTINIKSNSLMVVSPKLDSLLLDIASNRTHKNLTSTTISARPSKGRSNITANPQITYSK